jgi:Protein of unknown function (DUF1579)
VITGLAILVIQALPIMFEDQAAPSQDTMQAQMMKYGTPGKPHEFLKRFVGVWDVEITATPPTPGATPQKSKGTMTSELIFGGRYLKSDFDGMMGTTPSQGLQINGFDMFQNVYTTIWLDSWSTGFLVLTGKLDATGNVLTSTGQSPDPMTDGKTMEKLKTEVSFMSEMKYRFELYMAGPGGDYVKTLEMVFTRKR